ncbi:hypothetical protein HU200_048952 [Digitaria exilis]|uniref:BTB domain-containing protein n=1 Tax=Digitaria exilis TaxID=1010633 RepID=A0A835ECP6_9POAL|nr:hypothetical protein HU200_048952 [Digitaria exilis]
MSGTVASGAVGGSTSSNDGEALSASAIVVEAVTGSHVLKIEGYSLCKGHGNGKFINTDGADPDAADWISIFLHLDHTDAVVVIARSSFSVLNEIGEPVPSFSRYDDGAFDTFNFKKWEIRTEATTQFVTVPPSNMPSHFSRLLQDGHGVDVTFEVAGETFAAHRYVLAERSSVFMAELFGPMKEKAMDYLRVFKAMLHFIYTDTMPDIDKDDAFQHSCHGLKKACLNFLDLPSHLKAAMENEGFDHLMSSCPSVVKELMAKLRSLQRTSRRRTSLLDDDAVLRVPLQPSSLPRASLVRKRWFRLV